MSKLTDRIVFLGTMPICIIILILYFTKIISDSIAANILWILVLVVLLCILFKNHDANHAKGEDDGK